MENIQHKVTAYGLNQHDEAMLKSFINVLNFGVVSPWVYADDEHADVVIVDPDQKEGKQYVFGCKVGKHTGQVMVSVGEMIQGCQAAQSLAKPFRSGALRRMFDNLLDADGDLVDCKTSHDNENLPIH